MIAGTHITFASVLYLGGAALFEYETDLIGWALAAAASLLPDTDLPTSKFGRALFWVSTRLERRFGHRTITHSLVAIVTVAVLVSPLLLIQPVWFWCVVGGYWSHPWIDMLNIRGADLLWPSPIRVVMPGNRNWSIEVGSKAEMVLLTCLVVACLALYPVSGLGFRAGFQQLLGNFEMARDAFIEQAGAKWFTVELEAIDNLTLEHITCDCPVLGTWQSGLIVLHDGRPRALGKSQVHHNLYPTSTKLIEGEPLRVVSHKVDMRGRTLRWLIERLDKRHTYYLSGQMMVGSKLERVEDLDLYRPADFDGKVLRQHEADYQATEQRIALWKDKSGWAQERVKTGYDDAAGLWDVATKLTEEKANNSKLRLAITSQQHRVAAYAGDSWKELLDYLRAGEGPAKGDAVTHSSPPHRKARLPDLP